MSDCHPGKFSKMGGKCPTVIPANFQKREENVQLSSWQIFKNGRKMSDCHPGKFSKTGGKCVKVMLSIFSKTGGNCALVILVIFQKYLHKEENVQYAIWLFFQQRWKLSFSHNGNFSKIGGKYLAEITSEGGKTTWNKICWVDILLGESSLGSIYY